MTNTHDYRNTKNTPLITPESPETLSIKTCSLKEHVEICQGKKKGKAIVDKH